MVVHGGRRTVHGGPWTVHGGPWRPMVVLWTIHESMVVHGESMDGP